MTETPGGQGVPGPLSTAQELAGSLDRMTRELRRVQADVRRGRLIVTVLVVVIAAVVALGAVVGVTAVQAHEASTRARAAVARLRAVAVEGCQESNQIRAREVQLWYHVASLSRPVPGETPARAAARMRQVAAFLAYTRVTFAPRDCAAAYRLGR